MKITCNCGECRKCRHRECVRRLRRQEKINKMEQEGLKKDIEIMESLLAHRAYPCFSSLNPNVVFSSSSNPQGEHSFRRGFNYGFSRRD